MVKLLLVVQFAMLLWCACCSFGIYKCCCGEALARFAIRNVAVVKLLLALTFAMLPWSSSCSFWDLQCCPSEAPARFAIRNVDVVKLLLALSFAMLLWWSSCLFLTSQIRIAQTGFHPLLFIWREKCCSSVPQLHRKGFNYFLSVLPGRIITKCLPVVY